MTSHQSVATERLMKLPIENLKLTRRAYLVLKANNLRTVRDICRLTDVDLMRLANFGAHSLKSVRLALAGIGLDLQHLELTRICSYIGTFATVPYHYCMYGKQSDIVDSLKHLASLTRTARAIAGRS